MKKYALIALPSLIVLFSLLVWLLQQPEQVPTETSSIEIKTIDAPVEAKPKITEDAPAPQNVESTAIANASESTTSILENAEVDDMPPPVEVKDSAVLAYVAKNLDGKVSQWLVKEHILSKFVVAINSLEEGKLVSKDRPASPPLKTFTASKRGEQWELSQANYDRYTPYIIVLEELGADDLVKAYHHYYPALEDAFNELGVNKGNFESVTKKAILQLINAPELSPPPLLTQTSVMYKYMNPQLEKLPPAQKLMIRMGPENSIRLKTLLKKISAKI